MRPAITALAAALVLVGTASRAQDAAGTTTEQGAAAEPGSATVKPTVRPADPKLRTKLLFDVINVLTRPRPAAPAGTAAPPPVEPAAAPTAPASVPAEPKAAAVAVPPAPTVPSGTAAPPAVVVPREVSPQPAPAAPRPGTSAKPPPAPPVADPPEEPMPAEPPSPAPPPESATAQPAAPIAQESESILEPANSFPGAAGWLLLGLIAAAAVAATSARAHRMRRIARTRAALALEPRLDLSAGAFSTKGLALAGPPLAIRARLDWPEARSG